jgi:hypothetical protein
MAGKHMQPNQQQQHAPARAIFRTVPLAKRVHNWVERTPAGMAIDVTSAGLSLLTVITYMVSGRLAELQWDESTAACRAACSGGRQRC